MINNEFLRNPYPAYHALRQAGPMHWNEEFCGGAWLFTGYADVAGILRDPRFSVKRAGSWANSSGPEAMAELREFKRIFARSLLFVDAPQHTRLRQVMNAGFKPSALQALGPQIQDIVDRLLKCITAKPSAKNTTPATFPTFETCATFATFDFMRDFARPLPALVIAAMLGIDGADRAEFVDWSDDIAAFIGSPTPTIEIARRAQTGLIAMNDYFRGLLQQRRAASGRAASGRAASAQAHARIQPREDNLIDQLIAAEANGGIITTNELLAQCCTLLFAGHETTRNLLGNGMLALLQHPQQWQALQQDATLMPSALKELLRFDSPVQYTGRRLKVDVEMHGRVMKKGDLVIPLIGAANRDPAKFTAPDTLDLQRNQGAHLSFGYGPHVCIGATLTYLEADIAFRSVMQRLPQLALALRHDHANANADANPSWGGNAVYRALDTLPLQFGSTITATPAEDILNA